MLVDADWILAFGVPLLSRSACSSLRRGSPLLRFRSPQRMSANSLEAGGDSEAEKERKSLKLQRIQNSKLYDAASENKDPLLYSSSYNIAFMGLEKLHPFDSRKWGNIKQYLVDEKVLNPGRIVEPEEATKDDLLVVHTERYLQSLKNSYVVAGITEVPPVALLPNCIVNKQVLQPFRRQVGGTVLAARLAQDRGWAINLGGGFHHCCGYEGGGFCAYADITLCIEFALHRLAIERVMIVDLDAHQGNGHARDYLIEDGAARRVYIFDMYNRDIYPGDHEAKKRINRRVEVRSGITTDQYIETLKQQLEIARKELAQNEFKPQLVIYNAGTDILDGDPLGCMKVSPDGVKERDEIVFQFARRELNVPIVMLTSGGYMKSSARVIADSIKNLASKDKQLIGLEEPQVHATSSFLKQKGKGAL